MSKMSSWLIDMEAKGFHTFREEEAQYINYSVEQAEDNCTVTEFVYAHAPEVFLEENYCRESLN